MKKKKTILTLMLLTFIFTNGTSIVSAESIEGENNLNLTEELEYTNAGIDYSEPVNTPDMEQVFAAKDMPSRQRAASKIINFPFQTQQTNYWCGPASASMLLRSIGYNYSQTTMASKMGTTTNGTNAGAPVVNALNSVTKGSRYYFRWQWHNYSQVSTIKSHVVQALDWGNPVMVNTMEGPGDVYIRGHNIGGWLYHYGLVGDYFNYGNEVTYVDPGHGRFSGFLMNQRLTITQLSYATGGRGYAW